MTNPNESTQARLDRMYEATRAEREAEQAREAGTQSAPSPSRESARAQIDAISRDAGHPFFHPDHPGHQEAVAEMKKLGAVARGETAADLMQPGRSIRGPRPTPTRGTYENDLKQAGREWDHASGTFTPPELPADLPPAPEGQKWDPVMVQGIQEAAQDLGAPADETQEFLGYLTRYTPPADPDAAYAAGESTLKKEWGADFDAKMEAARFVYQRLPTALQVGIDESGLDNDPYLIRKLAELGGPMLAAKAEIERIMSDRSHPYWVRNHPQHDKAILAMRRLHERAHGTRKVG